MKFQKKNVLLILAWKDNIALLHYKQCYSRLNEGGEAPRTKRLYSLNKSPKSSRYIVVLLKT